MPCHSFTREKFSNFGELWASILHGLVITCSVCGWSMALSKAYGPVPDYGLVGGPVWTEVATTSYIPRPSIYPLLDPKWDHIPLFEGTRRVLVVALPLPSFPSLPSTALYLTTVGPRGRLSGL